MAMKTVGQVLLNFNPSEDKYISREFQSYGIYLSEELNDYKHKSLYIKLAKTEHRSLLEKALQFACDSTAKKKGALFMWKLKQLKDTGKEKELRIKHPDFAGASPGKHEPRGKT